MEVREKGFFVVEGERETQGKRAREYVTVAKGQREWQGSGTSKEGGEMCAIDKGGQGWWGSGKGPESGAVVGDGLKVAAWN